MQYVASALARYMSCPKKELVKHAVHVFRYLLGTVELALEFKGKGQQCALWMQIMVEMRPRVGAPLAMHSCCLVHACPGRALLE
jgi:hypothetical protein